jgi:hypothetical protein
MISGHQIYEGRNTFSGAGIHLLLKAATQRLALSSGNVVDVAIPSARSRGRQPSGVNRRKIRRQVPLGYGWIEFGHLVIANFLHSSEASRSENENNAYR